jgi:hypothetical protein
LFEFCETHYPTDAIMRQLVAVDYYLHFKVKPKERYLQEIDFPSKSTLLNKMGANRNKYRHIILPLQFDFMHYKNTGEVIFGSKDLCLQYDGLDKGICLFQSEGVAANFLS